MLFFENLEVVQIHNKNEIMRLSIIDLGLLIYFIIFQKYLVI